MTVEEFIGKKVRLRDNVMLYVNRDDCGLKYIRKAMQKGVGVVKGVCSDGFWVNVEFWNSFRFLIGLPSLEVVDDGT